MQIIYELGGVVNLLNLEGTRLLACIPDVKHLVDGCVRLFARIECRFGISDSWIVDICVQSSRSHDN